MASIFPEGQPQDVAEDVRDATEPVSRRGWGKQMLLGASALAVLFASTKPAEVQAAPPTDTWKLGGNAGVDATNFIGPTNSAPLIIKTGGVERMRVTASGNVGIGNASPTAKLLVDVANGVAVYARHTATTGDAPAVRGDTNSTVANASGVMGQITSTSPGSLSAGVWGENKATNNLGVGVRGTHASSGYGVHGQSGAGGTGVYGTGGYSGTFSTGGTYGLIAQATNAGSCGIYGSGLSTGVYGTGSTYGIHGMSSSTGVYGTGSAYGIYGEGTTGVYGKSTSGTGVFGTSSASNGVFGTSSAGNGVFGETTHTTSAGVTGKGLKYGIYGSATAPTGNSYGVYGTATTGWAGYFAGDVNVTGNVSKGGGSFKIDHPLDPENTYLYHSFVESPDMMNVYNGNVVMDASGEATVTLPAYFEALNRDFRYQLTCIGGYAPVYIAEKIAGNRFKIAGGKAGIEVSWQVTGIRQDAYANRNRIPTEEPKPSADRGRYLHPEAFGKPASMGLAAHLSVPETPAAQQPQPAPTPPRQ